MASNLQIHEPYVLKTLSRPLDRADEPGRHFVGEVFGQKQGSKKRKRSEVVIAIDGDSVHLYDIPSQQAVTSYLVPPQSFFTCAPHSLRWRSSTTRTATRFTYISTKDSESSKSELKVFKDVQTDANIATTVSTASHIHRSETPIVHLSTIASSTPSLGNEDAPTHDVVAMAQDGTILALNGETLEKKWQSQSTLLAQELPSALKGNFQVTFVQSSSAADVIDGLFGGKNELFGVFTEKIDREGFNPDILIAITSPKNFKKSQQRHLHILALTAASSVDQTRKQNIISVLAAPFPIGTEATKVQLDVKSGTLQELSNGVLYSYSFNSGIPRLDSKLDVPGMTSFLRLSKTSVLAATPTSISVYNPIYRSLQASTPITSGDEAQSTPSDDKNTPYELLTYLTTREIAVGLRGTSLVAIQMEAPKGRGNKRRAEGLLTDAIRRGLSREVLCEKRHRGEHPTPAILSDTLPGTMSEEYWAQWHSDVAKADKHLQNNEHDEFERMLAKIFKVGVKDKKPQVNGHTTENGDDATSLEWKWPSSRTKYPHVDRRWVFYAISKVFAWNDSTTDTEASHLTCRLPESNVLNYLVDAGHLTTSNIKSAFKNEISKLDEVDIILGEEISHLLAEVDPTMELLISYLSGTQLGPVELVSSVKLILRSLDLLKQKPSDPYAVEKEAIATLRRHYLEHPEEQPPSFLGQNIEEDKDEIDMELERAEQELQITEYYLGTDSSRRARGLSVAFSKLATCPTPATVQSLRRLLKPEDVICLMSVLRMELVKDGWTTRYLDDTSIDEDEEVEAPPDNSIQIIADLLCRCIDSIGLAGWMSFDSLVGQDSIDFFAQFKAEVTVALEGLTEDISMQATLAETVNYAKKAAKANSDAAGKGVGKMSVVGGPLPFGLKTDTKPSAERVRSGGELVSRTKREFGLFASRKRSSYAVHRISEGSLLQRAGITVVEEAAHGN